MARKNNKTRIFSGVYTDKNGKRYRINVRVNPRLVSLVLALVMVKTTACGVINPNYDKDAVQRGAYEDEYQNPNLLLIDKILKENPEMLKERTEGIYKVEWGDTLSGIADANGITLKELLHMNKFSERHLIRTGDEIKVETVKTLDENTQEINMLEAYLYDYVFNSQIAQIAKNEIGTNSNQSENYKRILYGNPKSENDVDRNSIYGRYVVAYLNYHDETKEKTEESIQNYIETLTEIAKDVDEYFNMGIGEFITTYDQFKIYCKNGNTLSDELETKKVSVYD